MKVTSLLLLHLAEFLDAWNSYRDALDSNKLCVSE